MPSCPCTPPWEMSHPAVHLLPLTSLTLPAAAQLPQPLLLMLPVPLMLAVRLALIPAPAPALAAQFSALLALLAVLLEAAYPPHHQQWRRRRLRPSQMTPLRPTILPGKQPILSYTRLPAVEMQVVCWLQKVSLCHVWQAEAPHLIKTCPTVRAAVWCWPRLLLPHPALHQLLRRRPQAQLQPHQSSQAAPLMPRLPSPPHPQPLLLLFSALPHLLSWTHAACLNSSKVSSSSSSSKIHSSSSRASNRWPLLLHPRQWQTPHRGLLVSLLARPWLRKALHPPHLWTSPPRTLLAQTQHPPLLMLPAFQRHNHQPNCSSRRRLLQAQL